MENGEVEGFDDNICEGAEAGGWEGGAELNGAIAPDLGVEEGFADLFRAELFVLQAGLVGADTFDHKSFVMFAEAFGPHRRVWHPEEDKGTPEGGEDSIGHENCLPGFEMGVWGNQ